VDHCQKSSKDNQVFAEQRYKNKGNAEAVEQKFICTQRRIANRKAGRRIGT
jgi:hypothetical protein